MLTTFKKICCPKIGELELEELIAQIEILFNQSSTHYFKNTSGDTTTVACVHFGDKKLVIKRYNFKGFWHAVKLQFRRSHAFRSFKYAKILADLKINTIKPIAAIQKKFCLIKKQSYFVSEYLEGTKGCEYFHDNYPEKSKWLDVADKINIITKTLKIHQIYHGDYHFGNFVIVNDSPYLLDFDRICKVKRPKKFNLLHQKDITNFQRYLNRNHLAAKIFNSIEGSKHG